MGQNSTSPWKYCTFIIQIGVHIDTHMCMHIHQYTFITLHYIYIYYKGMTYEFGRVTCPFSWAALVEGANVIHSSYFDRVEDGPHGPKEPLTHNGVICVEPNRWQRCSRVGYCLSSSILEVWVSKGWWILGFCSSFGIAGDQASKHRGRYQWAS